MPRDSNLTARNQEVLNFLKEFHAEWGYAPTIADIQEAFDFASPRGVVYHLGVLERNGNITRKPGAHRAIVLLDT